jgi:hypothetical protein
MFYSIEARAYDILSFAAHNFWVLKDDNDHVLGQLHGLATSPENKIKSIGKIGDNLKFYHFGTRAMQLGLSPDQNRSYLFAGQKSKLVFTDLPDQVLAQWDHAVNLLPYLNSLAIVYTPFAIVGFPLINSNTAYSLLGKIMGIPIHRFSRYWQPGWQNADKVLSCSEIEAMRYHEVNDKNDGENSSV